MPGLVIRVAFDVDVQKIGSMVGSVRILDASEMIDIARRERIAVGIVTVPPEAAQGVVDSLVEGGVSAILNFAASHVTARPEVVVSNIDISLELESLLLSLTERVEDPHRGGNARVSGSSI